MNALYNLVKVGDWPVAISHIQSLADCDAADQLFFLSNGWTAITLACLTAAPLELVQLMITKAKLDSSKRCLLAITDNEWWTALHWAARFHSDPAVLELLIREHPLALSATDSIGRTPQQYATTWNRPVAIASLLTDATNALDSSDYATLAARVHGDERTLRCLALTPDRLAVRTSLLLCLKLVYPGMPVTQTEPLDLRLAHARLCKDVWGVILEFV